MTLVEIQLLGQAFAYSYNMPYKSLFALPMTLCGCFYQAPTVAVNPESKSTSLTQPESVRMLPPGEPYTSYSEDRAAADKSFKDDLVQISMTVDKVGERDGQPVFTMHTAGNAKPIYLCLIQKTIDNYQQLGRVRAKLFLKVWFEAMRAMRRKAN